MKKLGIIGCGAIGTEIACAINNGDINVTLQGCHDKVKANFDALTAKAKNLKGIKFFETVEELVKECDLVLECASQAAVRSVFENVIKYKKEGMFLSVGGVLKNMDLFEQARKENIKIHIPSGAVMGIDGLNAAKFRGLKKVTLITRKPPSGFVGVQFLKDQGIDVNNIKEELTVFDGIAEDAVQKFPANINVAATLSLAGVGPKETHVKIVIDPFIQLNTHEIIVEGEFGRFRVITENMPSPNNPKTSYLTSLSTIVMIKNIVEPIHIGS